ncbi:exonuclease subunit SbcD [Pseudoalteromonas sp. SSDWG2]|uniref:exonuclease subunit SbcD n=1 Tax=Pseudoalteromonas sp. SSDWG2 TaxID=3139391 RepID=UPI003BAB28FE
MRLLHTSDWHLGQLFYDHERYDEHAAFLSWLREEIVQQKVDVLLISGDIYHTATPPTRAENQFYQFIKSVNSDNPQLSIVVIAGNHDSSKRITTAKPLLAQFNTHVVGHFEHQHPSQCVIDIHKDDQHLAVLALPYLRACDIADVRQSYSMSVKNAYQSMLDCVDVTDNTHIVALGHLHARGAAVSEDSERALVIGGEDAIGCDVFPEQASYVALGHLHKAQRVNNNEHIRYSGTPFAMSFAERKYQHQVVLVDLHTDQSISVNPLYIPQFRKLHLVPQSELLSLDEVCSHIREIEMAENEVGYIRVRLPSSELAVDFRAKIEDALLNKSLLFCGVERVRKDYDEKSADFELQDLGELERLDATRLLEIALEDHPELCKNDMSEEVKSLFERLVEEVELGGANEN